MWTLGASRNRIDPLEAFYAKRVFFIGTLRQWKTETRSRTVDFGIIK